MLMLGFSAVDWSIVIVYMIIATAPGFLCRKYIKGQDDFLVAGRTLSVYLATATLTATETGLITIMYMAQFGYTNGFSAMAVGVIALCCTLFLGLTGFMVSGLRQSGATTIADYYQKRYARGVRILGGFVIATAGILNYGVFLRVESDFIRFITGIPDLHIQTASGPVDISSIKLVMTVMVLLVLTYTLLGGMVSVVVTDYIQFIVMTAGIFGTTYWLLNRPEVGGFEGMRQAVETYRPSYGFNPFASKWDPATHAYIGVGVHKDLDVKHPAQLGVGEDQYPFDKDDRSRFDPAGHGRAIVLRKVIDGRLDGIAGAELSEVLDK